MNITINAKRNFKQVERIKEKEILVSDLEKILGKVYNKQGLVLKKTVDCLLLFASEKAETPMFIIKIAPIRHMVGMEAAKEYINEFELVLGQKYNCNNYILVSYKGYSFDKTKFDCTNVRFEELDYIHELIIAEQNNKPYIELFAHNKRVFDELNNILTNHNRACVVQATGTGKTFLICKLLLANENKRCLVVAPSNDIIAQIKKAYPGGTKNITLITYQKLCKTTDEWFCENTPDVVIFDEMHRLGASKWNKGFEMILRYNQDVKLVGFSATPIRYLDNCRNIKDELFENQGPKELNLTDAIARQILPPPTYVSALYSIEEDYNNVKNKIENSLNKEDEKKRLLESLDKLKINWEKTKGIDVILKKYIPDVSENMKFLVFCESIEHLNSIKRETICWFNKAYPSKKINEFVIHSKINNRNKLLKECQDNNKENEIDLLFSVNMFNEGLHIKSSNGGGIRGGVILFRRTSSPTIFFQQIGRALEANNESPVIFDFVNNFNNLKFNIFTEGMLDSYNKVKAERNALGLDYINENRILNVIDHTLSSVDIFQSIENKLYNFWDYNYAKLVEFKNENGHCNVPQRYPSDRSLGVWVSSQRATRKKGLLSQDKIEKLNELGFVWELAEDFWSINYNKLIKFKEKHGHCRVSRAYEDDSSFALWVTTQRKEYNKGELSKEKIDKLNELGFVWNIVDYKWFTKFDKANEIAIANGGVLPPSSQINDKDLLPWFERQRQLKKKGILSKDRENLLDSIGFKWRPFESIWEANIEMLLKYKSEYGNCNIAKKPEWSNLWNWCNNIRVAAKKNKLSTEQIKELNDIGFIWSHAEYLWNEQYKAYRIAKESNKPMPTPLTKWAYRQRSLYKENALSEEQIDKLNALDFEWGDNDYKWFNQYNQVCDYIKKTGSVEIKKKDNLKFYDWVRSQKRSYKSGRLSKDKIDMLTKIGIKLD